jgi:hypothetical protein
MSRATYPLKLPLSVKKTAQRLAKADGVSLNQWITAADKPLTAVACWAAPMMSGEAIKGRSPLLTSAGITV